MGGGFKAGPAHTIGGVGRRVVEHEGGGDVLHLARDAVLDWTQADMPYFRRRMVLEILRTTLL